MATTDDTADHLAGTRAITALYRSRPDLSAAASEWADWFDRKADLFDLIASREPWQAEEANAFAARARAEAARFRGEVRQ